MCTLFNPNAYFIVAQLAEGSLPKSEDCNSNTVICKILCRAVFTIAFGNTKNKD